MIRQAVNEPPKQRVTVKSPPKLSIVTIHHSFQTDLHGWINNDQKYENKTQVVLHWNYPLIQI